MQFSAKEIAGILQAEVEGDPSVKVSRPSKIEEGGAGSITFLGNTKYESFIYTTTASIVVVAKDFQPAQPISATLIRVDQVYEAFSRLLAFYDQAAQARPVGISAQAAIADSAQLADDVAVGRFTTVEANARIGAGCVLFDQVYIGAGVRLGDGVIVFPGARILHNCEIGDRCVIHANAVIGSDGFGFAPTVEGAYQKIPQVGKVVLEPDVDIGAGTTIDRATMGVTRIGRGCKIDNLVQIGHNVEIGPHTVIAAQAGVAGSTKIGAHCRIGGQVGFAGHLRIADGTQIQAQSGIAASVEQPRQALFGSPAIGYRDYIRSYAVFKQLPDLYKQLHQLQKRLDELNEG